MLNRIKSAVLCLGLLPVFIVGGIASGQATEPSDAQAPERLELGMYAPGIQFELIKEGPVPLKNTWKGSVHVVEFWATWCGPCKYSAPHLSKLQKKYGKDGLIVLGITDETSGPVARFLQDLDGGMEYNVAIDPSHNSSRTWMGGFGKTGIPYALVLDRDGRFAWAGHPMDPEMEVKIMELLAPKSEKKKAESSPQPPAESEKTEQSKTETLPETK